MRSLSGGPLSHLVPPGLGNLHYSSRGYGLRACLCLWPCHALHRLPLQHSHSSICLLSAQIHPPCGGKLTCGGKMKESRVCEGPFPLLQFHNCTALPVPVLMPVRSPRPRIASLALLATSSSRSSHPAEGSWPSECVPCIGPGVPLLGVIGTQSVGDENVLALKDVRGFSSSAT